MYAKLISLGCIFGAAMLFVLTVQVEPSYKVELVQSITDYLVTATLVIFMLVMAFVALLKWS